MSCCGGKRAAAHIGSQPMLTPAARPAAPAVQHSVSLRLTRGGSLVVRGPVTGLTYSFPAGESLSVDGRDVPRLIASGAFRRT